MTYAFTFDASACSGCKACQEACKDKNCLPAGILWRRVIEVTGGEWHTAGLTWENSVFAYNLALSCNHCTHPKCAGVCPTNAYTVRPDGIVLIDSSKCMGCGYCAWACPYGAPQYNGARGIMTKCDFCYDNLDAGLPPSCVSACPLRVLDYGTIEELETNEMTQNLWQLPGKEHPYPLPDYSRTEPHLLIKPHPGMTYPIKKVVSNREEVLPPKSLDYDQGIAARRELPLVAFTLLTQMAAGMAVWGLLLTPLPMPVMLVIGILLGVGGAISFLHLGRKRNAWRAVTHLNKSWLSREILIAGLFALAWVVTAGLEWFRNASPSPWPLAILGIGLVYCMSGVYHLRAVQSWNSWRTPAAFFLSAALLGVLGVRLAMPLPGWAFIAGCALVFELGLMLSARPAVDDRVGRLRIVLLGLGILGTLIWLTFPQITGVSLLIIIFIIALVSEVIGRWQFYARRVPFPDRSN